MHLDDTVHVPSDRSELDATDPVDAVAARLEAGGPNLLAFAARAVHQHPTDPTLLHLASLAALVEERPEHALRFLKRLEKRYVPNPPHHVIRALALAQQGRWDQARSVLLANGIADAKFAGWLFQCPNRGFTRRGRSLLRGIFDERKRPQRSAERGSSRAKEATAQPPRRRARLKPPAPHPEGAPAPTEGPSAPPAVATPPDPRHSLSHETPVLSVQFRLPAAGELAAGERDPDPVAFALRRRLAELGLARGFDELLCLPTLRSVDTYAYQVETVRKVLKQFRGRVLLADEVGLGKTIEAAMIVKEYLLRGMARRVLVLTPASLVGQWREELSSKFGLEFTTTHDAGFRRNPEAFWGQNLVVASIAAARRPPHSDILGREAFDVVVVDEAHHLKNRRTRGYALVNALRKRFLILLSATPVQNNLVELYNILTLLKPGILKTEKDFRALYTTPGKHRQPANLPGLRDLMRDVMVRNTRALVDVRLPPRHVVTLRPEPGPAEADGYSALSARLRSLAREAGGSSRLALRSLLAAAGSSPHAAARALRRFVEKRSDQEYGDLSALAERYAAIEEGSKERAFLELLAENPGERVMVFSHHRATLERLATILGERGHGFARFDGSMSGPEKDAAIARFRDGVPVLLSTESGGEGRNVQFANTIVNFDLPWNPMTLEQRIGRLHRIGQEREVFIFNLATRSTVEDRLLRVLDEKINMFELVVGEIGDILGELDDERDFADAVFAAWVSAADPGDGAQPDDGAFEDLERRLLLARSRHTDAKALDEALFGDEFEAA